MQITLNGRPHALAAPLSVRQLLEQLRIPLDLVAVQRNDDIVPRAAHDAVFVADGDRLEVITFSAGG